MADKFDITVNLDGKSLKRTLENLSDRMVSEFNAAVKNLAHGAFAKITATAQSRLSGLRQDYLKGLKFQSLTKHSYLIYLEGEWANKIEIGYPAFDMRAVLLNSTKIVQVGSRTGQPWVQKAKEDNHKFAHVPMEHKPFSKEPKNADLNAMIKKMEGHGVNGITQRMTKIFKDLEGVPLQGKVATGRSDDPKLDQMVKYQKTYVGKTGKQTTQSIYMTYRTVSEFSKGWKNKGYKGLSAFKEAEKWVESEIDNIIKNLGK